MSEPPDSGAPILEQVLACARRGWPVFPIWPIRNGHCACRQGPACPHPGKHPLGPLAPHGKDDATTDEDQLAVWWDAYPDANLGIKTGAESGLVVLDVDPRKGGDLTLQALEAKHGRLPHSVEALSGGGGRHVDFQHPGVPVPSRADALGPGLDVKADGGYVVGPPSLHASGRRYAWELSSDPAIVSLAPLPEWLLGRLLTGSGARSNGQPGAGETDWATLLEGAPEGERHQVALRIAGHLLARGLPPAEVEAILLGFCARCTPPFPEDEARRIVRDLAAKEARARAAAGAPSSGPPWPLYDAADAWEFAPVAQLIEGVLPLVGITWWGGLPKRYKSLLLLYICLAIAAGRETVADRFRILARPKILYVAREDGGSRINERRDDILSAWDTTPARGACRFVIRPHLDLLAPAHIAWLVETCRQEGCTLLILDTWTALSPSADPLASKDQTRLAAVVVQLAQDIAGHVIVVDHSRKNRPDGQALSSADIFGPQQKWAAAEHIVMLGFAEDRRGLIELFTEGKDLDSDRFFLTISPKGTGEEKFGWAGSAAAFVEAQRAVGDRNRQAIRLALFAVSPEPLSAVEVAERVRASGIEIADDTVRKHLRALATDGPVMRTGQGKGTKYYIPKADSGMGPSS
jgi:hypothetical protein